MKLFNESEIKSTVYLLDEIDLMCPTREYDDAILKQLDINRRQQFSSGPSSISTFASISDTESNDGKQQIDEMHKIHEKLDRLLTFQDWLKLILQLILRLVLLTFMSVSNIIYPYGIEYYSTFNNFINVPFNSSDAESSTIASDANNRAKFIRKIMGYISNRPCLYEDTNYGVGNSPSSSHPIQTPFTLRTLLNFISGGTTPDGLCIIATTNRPELLDPALTRAGRLRHMPFNYLRIQDAIHLIRDMFAVDGYTEDDIRQKLQEINYKDYQSSGALLSAVISSSVTLDQCIEVFDRELKELDSSIVNA